LPAALYLNGRAIVVHHHLGRGQVHGVRTPEEAGERASRILRRIRALDPQGAIMAKASTALAQAGNDDTPAPECSPRSPLSMRRIRLWGAIGGSIRRSAPWPAIYRQIEIALREGPTLPEVAVAYLVDHIERMGPGALPAAGLLLRCDNSSIVDYAFPAWQVRVTASGGDDAVVALLGELFLQPARRAQAAEKMRGALADNSAAVRLGAAFLLERLGTLDDIGLLTDLLSLPPLEDEDPRERPALLHAMQTLSRAPSASTLST